MSLILKKNQLSKNNKKYPITKKYEDGTTPLSKNDFVMFTTKYSEAYLHRLSTELINFAESPDAINIEKFLNFHRIPHKSFYEWVEKNKELKTAFEMAKSIIGCRREELALTGVHNATLSQFILPHYLHSYKSMLHERHKLQKEEANNPDIKIVMLEKFPKYLKKTAESSDDEDPTV